MSAPTLPEVDIPQVNLIEIDSLRIERLKKTVSAQKITIESLRNTNRNLHSRIFRLKSKLTTTKKRPTEVQLQGSINKKEFLIRQMKSERVKGYRYNHNEKMFSLSLWHSSPRCYRLLRTTFSLPSVTTLRRSVRLINLKPGFHQIILNGIKEKAVSLNEQESLVTIAFDEMSIKTNLTYNERIDNVIGYEDLGNGERTPNIANYASVFMIRSIQGSWKQSIGYFLTSGPMTADIIVEKLLECISHVRDCGLIPKVIICDQGPSNRGFYKLLKVNDDQYFINDNHRIYFLYDPPHLLKSIRNNLYNNGFIFKGNNISFEHIRKLYYIKQDDKIEIAGRLTDKHVNLNTFSKMKVNYAVQALSQSVASGIRAVVLLSNKLPKEAVYTADFCQFFNDLFDIFNSQGKYIFVYIFFYIVL